MAATNVRWWVWYRRPGLPHEHATEFGGQSCATQTRAWEVAREKIKAGYIIEIYQAPDVRKPQFEEAE